MSPSAAAQPDPSRGDDRSEKLSNALKALEQIERAGSSRELLGIDPQLKKTDSDFEQVVHDNWRALRVTLHRDNFNGALDDQPDLLKRLEAAEARVNNAKGYLSDGNRRGIDPIQPVDNGPIPDVSQTSDPSKSRAIIASPGGELEIREPGSDAPKGPDQAGEIVERQGDSSPGPGGELDRFDGERIVINSHGADEQAQLGSGEERARLTGPSDEEGRAIVRHQPGVLAEANLPHDPNDSERGIVLRDLTRELEDIAKRLSRDGYTVSFEVNTQAEIKMTVQHHRGAKMVLPVQYEGTNIRNVLEPLEEMATLVENSGWDLLDKNGFRIAHGGIKEKTGPGRRSLCFESMLSLSGGRFLELSSVELYRAKFPHTLDLTKARLHDFKITRCSFSTLKLEKAEATKTTIANSEFDHIEASRLDISEGSKILDNHFHAGTFAEADIHDTKFFRNDPTSNGQRCKFGFTADCIKTVEARHDRGQGYWGLAAGRDRRTLRRQIRDDYSAAIAFAPHEDAFWSYHKDSVAKPPHRNALGPLLPKDLVTDASYMKREIPPGPKTERVFRKETDFEIRLAPGEGDPKKSDRILVIGWNSADSLVYRVVELQKNHKTRQFGPTKEGPRTVPARDMREFLNKSGIPA